MTKEKYLTGLASFSLLVWLLLPFTTHAEGIPLAKPGGPPICPHILGWPEDVKVWAEGAPWIKALDVTSCLQAKERGARVLYRVWDHASGPDGDTSIGGQKFGDEILERLGHMPKDMWPDAISYQNEFNNVSPEAAQTFMDMYDVLRKGGYKGLIVFGSYGPGGPTDMTEWERPHIKAACLKADAIETHEYWDLTIKHYYSWLAHRHIRAMNTYPWLKTKPWFIGEFGSDGVNKGEDPQNRSGWRDRDKLTEEEYIKQIEIYRHGDPSDEISPCAENVLAVFLFQQGAPNQWEKWEIRGTKVMDYMKSTWPPTVATLTGKITDADGKPIEGAQVTVSPRGKKANTDAKGVFWFFALKPGEYTVKTTLDGYETGKMSLTIKAGDIAQADITMKPAGP